MNEKLIAKREEILFRMSQIIGLAETETRSLNEAEIAEYDTLKIEAENIQKTIKINEERAAFEKIETKQEKQEKSKVKDIRQELRTLATDANAVIDIGSMELRNTSHVLGADAVGTGNVALENIAKITYANFILDKLVYISPLYNAVRKERFGSATHQIPVQANKLGKFVPMKELATYTKQIASFDPVILEAHKYGTVIAFSEEVLEDTGYNVEAELLRQLYEAYGITLDELIIAGDAVSGAEGLRSFVAADGSPQVVIPANITFDTITEMYFSLKIPYRNMSSWVMSDATFKDLYNLKDAEGRPLIVTSYQTHATGAIQTLLGRPIIINEFAGTDVYFGDLNRAVIVGERAMLQLQKSLEVGFMTDEVYIKANMRLDIKKALGEAIVVGKKAAAGASVKSK